MCMKINDIYDYPYIDEAKEFTSQNRIQSFKLT